MKIEIPNHALILTLGPAGCGKSTFASTHFGSAVVSSDECRRMVSDDATNQEANRQAFDLFHRWIEARLQLGRLAVADATNLSPRARRNLRDIASKLKVPVIVFRFATDLDTCLRQNRQRDRFVPEHVIHTHHEQYEQARQDILTEGYAAIHTINPLRDYEIVVQTGARTIEGGGFDIIGDIHGCYEELNELLLALGYEVGWLHGTEGEGSSYVHPEGRKLVFVGDITDRGPYNVQALRTVKLALEGGHHAVMGNHDNKLMRALKGNNVKPGHGLAQTLEQLAQVSDAERATFLNMLIALPYQLTLKVEGKPTVLVSHAGLPKELEGKDNNYARNHAIYGEVTGKTLEDGKPERGSTWTQGWTCSDNEPFCVHGHTVVDDPQLMFTNVICVDQGCVFGGKLTALRYPEMEFVQIPAKAVYHQK